MVLADEPAGRDAEGETDEDLLRQGQPAARRPSDCACVHPVRSSGRQRRAGIRRFYLKDSSCPRAAAGRVPLSAEAGRRVERARGQFARIETRGTRQASGRGGSVDGNRHSSARPPAPRHDPPSRPTTARRGGRWVRSPARAPLTLAATATGRAARREPLGKLVGRVGHHDGGAAPGGQHSPADVALRGAPGEPELAVGPGGFRDRPRMAIDAANRRHARRGRPGRAGRTGAAADVEHFADAGRCCRKRGQDGPRRR